MSRAVRDRVRDVRFGWAFAALVYFFFGISVFSQIPGQTLAEMPFDIWDKLAHFVAYAPFGAALGFALLGRTDTGSACVAILGTAVITALFGGLDELHQTFVAGRFCSLSDAVADVLGATFGALAAVFVFRVIAKRRRTRHT